MATETKCHYECGRDATLECAKCKVKICDDIMCGQQTTDGYLCGFYTQWGCGRKYTTCDICLNDEAVHEGDLDFCEECGNAACDDCSDECEKCNQPICVECIESHECQATEPGPSTT
jgi:hypothetical protein